MEGSAPDQVVDGVWRVVGGFPLRVNAYLVREDGGVAVFDAGIRSMGPAIRQAAEQLGGPRRLILGNAHADHRGGSRAIGATIQCHPDERGDVEGDGGAHYFDFSKLLLPNRLLTPRMMSSWDSGPLQVDGTLAEGDRVGDFEVVHLPGHSPGCIGLWRERDRVAITNDCFALFDPNLPFAGRPRVPHPAFNWSTDAARESMRKLAGLHPAVCLPGHYGPLKSEAVAQLEAAL
jgi:glyoxylase-like metal-dependent hydrolase (beta-lactamase superfamily II)